MKVSINPVKDLSCDENVCGALTYTGGLYLWGDLTKYGKSSAEGSPVYALSGYVSVVAGYHGTCVSTEFGAVHFVGSSVNHMHGTGTSTHTFQMSVGVNVELPDNVNIRRLAGRTSSKYAFCGIVEAETLSSLVYCWGFHSSGVTDFRNGVFLPGLGGALMNHEDVLDFGEHKLQMIAASQGHTCIILDGGEVHCRGANNLKQSGQSSGTWVMSPTKVNGILPARKVYTSPDAMTCIIDIHFEAWCWGHPNSYRGGKYAPTSATHVPWKMQDMKFSELALGSKASCGIRRDSARKVYCWGDIRGDSMYHYSVNPTLFEAQGKEHLGAISIAISGDYTYFLVDQNKQTYAWGQNANGLLDGVANIGDGTSPKYASINAIRLIRCGNKHCCASRGESETHRMFCWGSNADGASGDFDNVGGTSGKFFVN